MHTLKIIRGEQEQNSFYVMSNYGLLLFDTGAASSQLQKSPATASLPKKQSTESHGLFGSKTQEIAEVGQLSVGDIHAENLQVTLDDTTGILGNDVLKDYAFTLDTQKDEIILIPPFESNIRCTTGQRGHLYVEMKVGSKSCMALIDTGASCSIIDEAFYMDISGNADHCRTEKGEDWTGASFETKMATVDSLSIGGIPFPSHEFALLDFKQVFPFAEHNISAIIGATTLSCKKFSFSLPNGYISIADLG